MRRVVSPSLDRLALGGPRPRRPPHAGRPGDETIPTGVLWDAEKNVECAPTLSADGKTRCLPVGVNNTLFADDDCTEPVIARFESRAPECSSEPDVRYILHEVTAACPPSGTTVYEVGPRIEKPPTQCAAQLVPRITLRKP